MEVLEEMRMEQLKYFSEVAKCHSIAIAAEKLFVTQPTISIAIKNMEKELDCVLLERSKNGATLTTIGREVLEKCEMILQQEKEIYTLVLQNKANHLEKLQGQLSIVSIPVLMHAFLYDTIFDFLNDNDEVDVWMKEANVEYIIDIVLNGEEDIGFTLLADGKAAQLLDNETLCAKKLYGEKTYVVAHKCFELGGNSSIRSDQLNDLPIASFNTMPITCHSNLPDKQKGKSHITLQTYSLDLIKRFVFSGKAVAALPSSVASKMEIEEDIDIVPISDLDIGKVYCFYRRDNPKQEILAAFEAEVLRQC